MSGLTVSQARTRVSKKLNDTEKRRYEDTAHIDPALIDALEATLIEYAEGEGADYLLAQWTGTTDATGELDISSEAPLIVKGVSIVDGTRYYPIQRRALYDGYSESPVAKDLAVYGIATITSFGLGSSPLYDHAHAFKAFDKLVCVRAALELAGNEDRAKAGLMREEEKLRRTVADHTIAGSPRRLPSARSNLGFEYVYMPDTQAIQLVRASRRGV